MRNNKNNITLSLENIISFSRNITSHFTGKEKIITLVSIIIMLSFVNITLYSSNMFSNTNVSALSYQSNVGVGFTFNPTLSVNISPSNLVIDNLTPNITVDSNAITVSVATNAAYGYTLSAMVNNNNNGNSGNGSNNNNSNSNLTHTNGTSIFSSIATDASLSSLTNDNTWGYSYRLSSSGNSNAWSNYSGLSNETSKTLVESNDQTAAPIDFKIAAKASETQPSGAYTGTINFAAVSKHIPVSLAEAYASEGKTMFNGYYTMQDMNSAICSKAEVTDAQLQVIDTRDKKVYWIAKLKDGHCWMTQNLDFDIIANEQDPTTMKPLTSKDTDLTDHSLTGAYLNGYNYDATTDTITWTPTTLAKTINFAGTNVNGWNGSFTSPRSASKTDDANIGHASLGNWYNWAAAVASNDTNTLTDKNAANSICPKNWRLPNANNNEFATLNNLYNNGSTSSDTNLLISPLWLMRSGNVDGNKLNFLSTNGYYWTATSVVYNVAYNMRFSSNDVQPNYYGSYYGTDSGFSIRCLAR